MPGTNGKAMLHAVEDTTDDDALDLGDLIPETRAVRIKRDGLTVTLDAFMYRTAPVSVYALIAQAHDEYQRVLEDTTVSWHHREQATCRYFGQAAKALVVGLTADEADRLGGDFPRLERMLKVLGFPPKVAKTMTEGESGEVEAVESISDASSVASDPSTAAVIETS